MSLTSPVLAGVFFTSSATWEGLLGQGTHLKMERVPSPT